jgi:hypothetical protein
MLGTLRCVVRMLFNTRNAHVLNIRVMALSSIILQTQGRSSSSKHLPMCIVIAVSCVEQASNLVLLDLSVFSAGLGVLAVRLFCHPRGKIADPL